MTPLQRTGSITGKPIEDPPNEAYKTVDDQSKKDKNSRKQSRNRGATIKEETAENQTFGVKKNLSSKNGSETG
jgi:hypothetical protein